MVVSESEPWAKTYGSLFTFLSAASGDIPVGIYRTEIISKTSTRQVSTEAREGHDDVNVVGENATTGMPFVLLGHCTVSTLWRRHSGHQEYDSESTKILRPL